MLNGIADIVILPVTGDSHVYLLTDPVKYLDLNQDQPPTILMPLRISIDPEINPGCSRFI